MSQALCRGPVTRYATFLKGGPRSQSGWGQSWGWTPGRLNSKPTRFMARDTSAQERVAGHSNRAESPSFDTCFPHVTRYKERARATSTNRPQSVGLRDDLRSPAASYQEIHLYMCIYRHFHRYTHVHGSSTHRHTDTYTYLHTHGVDTSPIWNSAIQRPHLSGTQPRTRK